MCAQPARNPSGVDPTLAAIIDEWPMLSRDNRLAFRLLLDTIKESPARQPATPATAIAHPPQP